MKLLAAVVVVFAGVMAAPVAADPLPPAQCVDAYVNPQYMPYPVNQLPPGPWGVTVCEPWD